MIWNSHEKLLGTHAFLGASNYHWINWSDDIIEQKYYDKYAVTIGTLLHELAKECIDNKIRLTKSDKRLIDYKLLTNNIPKKSFNSEFILQNLLPFVNDAIGFKMDSEVLLYYSSFCYGTTDSICFNEKDNILRIHDLKTGVVPAHIEQLMIYASLFCLEYNKKPQNFNTELRIYQNSDILVYNPEPEEIEKFMDIIVSRSEILKKIYLNER